MSDNAGRHGKGIHVGGWGPEIPSPISALDMGVPLPIVVYTFVKQDWGRWKGSNPSSVLQELCDFG